MRTLQEAVSKLNNKNGAGSTLRKHLEAAGITDWSDITTDSLYEFREEVCETLAPASAKTVCAYLKALLNRHKQGLELPDEWEKIINVRGEGTMKTFLTEDELKRLEKVETKNDHELFVKNVFLICAFTGLRISDAMRLTTENIVDGNLHFVAKKTKKVGAIPLKRGLEERIEWVSKHLDSQVTLVSYNEIIRHLCAKAKINAEVIVYKAGKEMKGPKWRFVTSHTARVSAASCLFRRGVPVGDICTLLQHSGLSMTERYIVRDHVELSDKAMRFFQ